MKEKRIGLWVVCLFVLISLCGIREVQSQDVFRDIDQIKRDISDLKNEISDLRNQLFGIATSNLEVSCDPGSTNVGKIAQTGR